MTLSEAWAQQHSSAGSPAKRDPLLSAAIFGGARTYVEYEGRGWSEALDTDIGQHFKHVTFPACNVDEPEKTMQGTERTPLRSPARPSSVLWKELDVEHVWCLAVLVRDSPPSCYRELIQMGAGEMWV